MNTHKKKSKFLTRKEILEITGKSNPTLWRWTKAGTFPKPYKLKESDGLVLTLFGYAVGGMSGFQLQSKGTEIAKITGHSEFDIGRAVGILKQGNLVRV